MLEKEVNNNRTVIVNITFTTEYQTRLFRIMVPLRMTNSLNCETLGIRCAASRLYLRNSCTVIIVK